MPILILLNVLSYALVSGGFMAPKTQEATPPNIIIIYNDDLGYGDVGAYGAPQIETPNIDLLAENGLKLTDFYVASSVCSPSRAALLTGCYPVRVGIPNVLAPHGIDWAQNVWRHGLNPEEETLAELLKTQNFTTAIIGKWHLGHLPEHLPGKHGFDTFFGLPYSNDMIPATNPAYPPLTLIRDSMIVEENPDQASFTRRFTQEALQFIEQNRSTPFFLYLAHPMPHVPIFASEAFRGRATSGTYGDVIEEIDWSVGAIAGKLDELGLRDHTILIFTSDNGPWLEYGNHAGSPGKLREGKHTTFEGGQRVPFILSWPGKIRTGTSNEIVTNMDLLPTLIRWAGVRIQPSKKIDGIAMNAFFEGSSDRSGRDEFLYYKGTELQAVRRGKWKLHLPHPYSKAGDQVGKNGKRGNYDPGEIDLALFDLKHDPGETSNILVLYPQVADSLLERMHLADSILQREARPPGAFRGEAPPVGRLWHH